MPPGQRGRRRVALGCGIEQCEAGRARPRHAREPGAQAAEFKQYLRDRRALRDGGSLQRSEEHTSELQSLMRISYAVFCLKKEKTQHEYRFLMETRISKR